MILLFGLMAFGYFLNKVKILDTAANGVISRLLVNAAIPATIIHSSVSGKAGPDGNVIRMFAIAIGFYLVVPFLSRFLAKLLKQDGVYQLMLTYSNLGFMGIPVISSLYGEESVIYVTIFMIFFNISIFSHGVYILAKENEKEGRSFQFRTLINPGVVCSLVGMVLFVFRIPIPEVADKLLVNVGSITTPLAMIVIGSSLAEVSVRSVFSDKSLYALAILKLLVYPAIVYAGLYFIIKDPMIRGIAVILTAMPTAGNVSMLCSEYGGDMEKVSKGTFITTLLSVVAIPLWMSV
ncbi:MAG: AEC family transporter [Eubacterium sp.]|nr:AEC family transporter [Eubacterium sp.]